MEKKSSFCRVLAQLVVHQIAKLQLTAPPQESATNFTTGPRYFLQICSKISDIFSRYFVLVLQWRCPCQYAIVVIVHSNHQQKQHRQCAATLYDYKKTQQDCQDSLVTLWFLIYIYIYNIYMYIPFQSSLAPKNKLARS